MCASMKWNHLPVAGGIYDQHPDVLDKFRLIFNAQADHDEAERMREQAKAKRRGSRSNASGY